LLAVIIRVMRLNRRTGSGSDLPDTQNSTESPNGQMNSGILEAIEQLKVE
jgi:hypothetical protein